MKIKFGEIQEKLIGRQMFSEQIVFSALITKQDIYVQGNNSSTCDGEFIILYGKFI